MIECISEPHVTCTNCNCMVTVPATIKTDNTQALYNALAEIERLKSYREEEAQGLWRVIEGHRADKQQLQQQVDLLRDALHKIATGRGRNSKGTHYYSCYDSLQSVARDALAKFTTKESTK